MLPPQAYTLTYLQLPCTTAYASVFLRAGEIKWPFDAQATVSNARASKHVR